MDRMIHTAFNSLKNIYDQRFRSANNLSNVNVPGFRRDLPDESGSRNLSFDGMLSARSFSLETGSSTFSAEEGTLNDTGVSTDVAIVGEGYFFIQPENGTVALSRRGDLSIRADGILINGGNAEVLDRNLQPITVPAFREFQVTHTGEILVDPIATPPGEFISVGFIGATNPLQNTLFKDIDGQVRTESGDLPPVDTNVKIAQSMLEAANVNSVEELVNSMELQRQFEISIKFISLAKELDEGGTQLMRMPEG